MGMSGDFEHAVWCELVFRFSMGRLVLELVVWFLGPGIMPKRKKKRLRRSNRARKIKWSKNQKKRVNKRANRRANRAANRSKSRKPNKIQSRITNKSTHKKQALISNPNRPQTINKNPTDPTKHQYPYPYPLQYNIIKYLSSLPLQKQYNTIIYIYYNINNK